MEIVLGTAASVATTIITVLGAIFYLDRKIEANRREHSAEIKDLRGEIKEVRVEIKDVLLASQNAHTSIRQDLAEIKIQQAAHTERLKCIESHLQVKRPED